MNEYAKMSNYSEQLFLEWLNFTNDQHPQSLWNLRTFKKPTIQYRVCTFTLCIIA